jgi:hypothetical protein
MENILLKQIVSMLIIACMLTPLNGVIADDPLNKPDIELSFDECIHPTENESDYTFILRMQNRGMNVAENISVIVYCGTPEDLLLNETITSLNPQQFHNLSFEWNNTPGDYQFFAIADEDNVINESNEQNNEGMFILTVRNGENRSNPPRDSNYRYTWREGEYWNTSEDTSSYPNWKDYYNTGSSNNHYACPHTGFGSGDWAEWKYEVDIPGTYYFWIRHWVGDKSSDHVSLYWDDNYCDYDLIDWDNWYTSSSNAGYRWTYFGSKTLSSGPGRLKIVGESDVQDYYKKHFVCVDNVLITNEPDYQIDDSYPGNEGGDDYVIGSNTPPELSNGGVDPDGGCTETTFTYWVNYADDENDLPVDTYVYIDGVANNMNFSSQEGSGQTMFYTYNFSTQLSEDEHTYYFVFSDGYENDQLPESGTFSGPNVWAENYPPQLKYGGVDPDTGYTTDTFTFHVWYKDNESNAPEKKEVHYRDDSMWHTGVMSPTGQVNTEGFEKYECDASGFSECSSNVFYFLFNDDISNHDDTRFPESGYCNGPVVSENDPPIANDDSASTDENTAVWIDVLDNDVDSEGTLDPSSVMVTSGPSHGSTSVNTVSGEVEYVPDSGFYGSDSFMYTVDDTDGATSNTATVSITVNENPNEQIPLDYDYIWNVTEWLSDVINTSYLPGELAKGRAFGTQGEWDSADQILYWMNQLGLNPTMEQITDIDSLYNKKMYFDDLNDKLQINAREAKINDQSVDCYISPQWNNTLLHPWGDRTELTHNNTPPPDLKIYHRPMTFFDYFEDFLFEKRHIINTWMYNGSNSFLEFMVEEYENYHDFTFEELNETNAFDIFPWFTEVYGQYSSANRGSLDIDPYVYIGENPGFNPNPSVPMYYSWINNLLNVNGAAQLIERLIWYKTLDQCYGLILYDFNDHTFDMNYDYLMALPTIYINGSIGKDINQSVGDYTLDYFIDQEWNPSVISYNVFGEIPGNNSDETVIVCCLYDSWWNQGTADSAIGIGMMLSIAKYYQDNNIIPERNMKFIAFGGEEYGMRGAFHYEAEHLDDETVTTVIDLNQLGFTQNDPRLTLNVISNSECVNTVVSDIVDDTNYVERTGNVTDLRMITTGEWNPISDYMPFADATKRRYRLLNPRSCKTICFVKDRGENPHWRWILHHRDGEDHTWGDVLSYYDETDVRVTTEMILNVTRYFETETEPLLHYEPSSIHLDDLMEGTSDSTSFDVWNSGAGTLTYSLSESCSWMSISPMSGSSVGEHDTITVDIDTTGLSSGYHTGDIYLSSDGGSGIITVNFTVVDPVLAFSPASFDFGTMQEGENDSTSFDIWNGDSGCLTYSLSENCNWVSVNPTSGSSTGEYDTIIVDIDTTGLSDGTYSCDIDIVSNGGNGVFTVEVTIGNGDVEVLDVNQSVYDRGHPIRHASDGDWGGAQNFVPTVSTITRVELYLRSFGTAEFDLVVELRENGPEGLLLDSVSFAPGDVSSDWSWVSVDFSDVSVQSGTDYFIVCPPPPSGVTSSFGYEWGYALGNLYDDGAFWFTRDGGSLWRDLPDSYEFTFRSFGYV